MHVVVKPAKKAGVKSTGEIQPATVAKVLLIIRNPNIAFGTQKERNERAVISQSLNNSGITKHESGLKADKQPLTSHLRNRSIKLKNPANECQTLSIQTVVNETKEPVRGNSG